MHPGFRAGSPWQGGSSTRAGLLVCFSHTAVGAQQVFVKCIRQVLWSLLPTRVHGSTARRPAAPAAFGGEAWAQPPLQHLPGQERGQRTWERPVLSAVSVGPCVGVLPSDSWGWERGDREKNSRSGSDGGMDLLCSRAETEAAPWAQGQGSRTPEIPTAHPAASAPRGCACPSGNGPGWRAGQGRESLDARGAWPSEPAGCPHFARITE